MTTTETTGVQPGTPIHLWIVGIASLFWNAMGAFDYLATKFHLESYMSQFSPEQLDYFTGLPAWAVAAWAFAVWGALAGSVGLLFRKKWSLWAFAVSLVGLAVSTVYTWGLSGGIEIMDTGHVVFSAVIWIVAVLLVVYARVQTKSRVLG